MKTAKNIGFNGEKLTINIGSNNPSLLKLCSGSYNNLLQNYKLHPNQLIWAKDISEVFWVSKEKQLYKIKFEEVITESD